MTTPVLSPEEPSATFSFLMGRKGVSPGLVIRAVLTGELPLVTYEGTGTDRQVQRQTVSRASVTDLHKTYKQAVWDISNAHRALSEHRGVMTYMSFSQYLRYALYLELIEPVGTEPPVSESALPLSQIRGGVARPTSRTLYALTPLGRENASLDAWAALSTAYRQSLGIERERRPRQERLALPVPGPMPEPMSEPELVLPPLVAPVPVPAPRPTAMRMPVPKISLPERYSIRSIPRLLEHLQNLRAFEDRPEASYALGEEAQAISSAIETWADASEEVLANEEDKDYPNEERIDALNDRIEALRGAIEALDNGDLDSAIESLETLE